MAAIRNNWFLPLIAGLWGFVWLVANRMPSALPEAWEYAVLFDIFVTVPVLFWLCYRNRLTSKIIWVRILALQCLGIWVAAKIIPLDQQHILPGLEIFRYLGLAVLILIEIRLLAMVLKTVFRKTTSEQDLVAQGAPPFIAKLMLIEARFWRWLFGKFKG